MPRYYDIDKLAEMLKAKADTLLNGKEAFLYVAKWLDLLPAADVEPKSEVERLEEELIVERTRRENAVNAYHGAKREVAKEAVRVFAERLKEEMQNLARWERGEEIYFIVGESFIDNIAKEMTEVYDHGNKGQ